MEAFSAVYDTYRDATLAAFRKRGGKLLIFHGTADPIFSALESIDYYQRLDAQQRRGRGHGPLGPAVPRARHESLRRRSRDRQLRRPRPRSPTGSRRAPRRLASRRRRGPARPYFPGRTRPLCAYPAYARYTGSGSLEDGANFTCVTPPSGPRSRPTRAQLPCADSTTGFTARAMPSALRLLSRRLRHRALALALWRCRARQRAARDDPAGAEAGSDPLVWDLTNTHGSRFRTVFMRAANTPFGLELSEFFDIPRGERPANPWDPGASRLDRRGARPRRRRRRD